MIAQAFPGWCLLQYSSASTAVASQRTLEDCSVLPWTTGFSNTATHVTTDSDGHCKKLGTLFVLFFLLLCMSL